MITRVQALLEGDRVGLFAPAGPAPPADLVSAYRRIAALGFEPVLGAHTGEQWGYLAGQDEARLADLQEFIDDPSVRALIAVRGGYGTGRLLADLNLRPLLQDPRPVVGFSDLTLLHLDLAHNGLVSFHGPMPGTGWSDYQAGGLARALTCADALGPLDWPEGYAPWCIRAGVAEGPLVGGNLSLVTASLGTPWEVQSAGAVLLLEEVGEAPYRIDRLLWQLQHAGKLQAAAAVVLGEFVACVDADRPTSELGVDEVLRMYLEPLGIPVLGHAPCGHGRERATLPLGVRVRIDSQNGQLTFLEPALDP